MDKYYKKGREAAANAIVNSIARHKVSYLAADTDSLTAFVKLSKANKLLGSEKVSSLEDMVDAAEKTEHISVDIKDSPGNTKNILGEFDDDGNMSLHVIRGSSYKLDRNIDGKGHVVEKGENSRFYKNVTGKSLSADADKLVEKTKKKVGLKEDLSYLFEESIHSGSEKEYRKYVEEHIKNVAKAYEYIKENLPELFEELEISIDEMDKRIKEHDASKFSKEEFKPYANYWFGKYEDGNYTRLDSEPQEYKDAVEHHYKVNPHHEKHWNKKDMPISYVIELLADWLSFGFKMGEPKKEIRKYWFSKRDEKKENLSKRTFKIIDDSILKLIGFNRNLNESEFSDDLKNIYGDFWVPRRVSLDEGKTTIPEISDIIDEVKDIIYGFISKKDGCKIVNRDWIHNCKNLSDYYEVQTDPEITLKEKLGICTDQCLAIKYLFEKLHPDYKTQMYALMKGRFGHCVIGFMTPENKWYYLENAWDKQRGLHGPFETKESLEDYFNNTYYNAHKDDNDDDVIVMTYEDYTKASLNESFIILPNIYYSIEI